MKIFKISNLVFLGNFNYVENDSEVVLRKRKSYKMPKF